MTRVRVEGFTISLDGFGAGPGQDIDNPLGIGGGPGTIREYLGAGLIDELHIAMAPVQLGSGERLFDGVDMRALGYECVEFVASQKATHVVLRRQGHTGAGHSFTR